MRTDDSALLADRLDASLAEELERLLVERAAVAFGGHYLGEDKEFKYFFIR